MKGFIIHPTYRIMFDRAYIFLFGKLENGESFVTMNYFRPYFFIKAKDLNKANKLDNFESEKVKMNNFNGEKVVKIILDLPSQVSDLRKLFEENDIECYEADIKFVYRFLIDNNLLGSVDVEGDFESGEKVDRIYKEPIIKSVEYFPKLKVLSFDIETNPSANKIYSISFYGSDNKSKVYIVSDKKVKGAEICKDEEILLYNFCEYINNYDPDIITGWNVIDFDLKVIQKRAKKFNLNLNFGRDNRPPKLRLQKSYFKASKANVPGRLVLDGIELLKMSFLSYSDYKLDSVAQEVLGESKLLKFENKVDEILEFYKNDPETLVKYNLKDAKLVLDILNKTKVINLSIKRSLLTGLPLDRVSASIASLDSLYIRETKKKNLVCPSLIYKIKEKGITGGYVKSPEPGVYSFVDVLDFKSIYPSLILTFNIDPISFLGKCKRKKNVIKAPNGACFKNENGILPQIILRLWNARNKAREEKDELARYAIKIHMNSFFGVLASPNCRFFNIDIANAITHFGQFIIKKTSDELEKRGVKNIYSDTDSTFVLTKAKNLDEAIKIGKKLEKEINDFYNKFIKQEYDRKSHLEIEFEKCYFRFLMPKVRKKSEGAKKRYAGLIVKDGKEKIEITGLEAVRSDWTELAKKLQYQLLWKLFHDASLNDFKIYINQFIKDLKDGKYDDLLVYSKNLRKDLDEYVKTTPPHVKAARKLAKLSSNNIKYVLTLDGPEPISNIKHEIDYEHYVKKQIEPIVNSILDLFDTNLKDLLSSQKSLLQF